VSRLAQSLDLKQKEILIWMFSLFSDERYRNSFHFLDLSRVLHEDMGTSVGGTPNGVEREKE
jgi:hypothetical protein